MPLSINVKFSSGISVPMEIEPTETIYNVKKEIKKNCINQAQQKLYVRLLFRGKFLEDHCTVQSYKLENQDTILCVMTETMQPSRRTFSQEIQEVSDHPRGFDRLGEMGISSEEIVGLRSQFYNSRPDILVRIRNEQISTSEIHDLEEEWLNEESRNQPNRETDEENEFVAINGSNYHLFFGFCIGFMFGFLSLVWLLDESLQRKFKLGIIGGIGINLSFSLVRYSVPIMRYL
jgi:hypothetical protein